MIYLTMRRVVLIILFSLLLSMSVALAATVSGTMLGVGAGNFFLDTSGKVHWGGVIILDMGGHQAGTFCTDLHHPIGTGDQVFATDQAMDCRVKWLVHHYPPLLSGLSNDEAAARQAAVWHFSDNVNPLRGYTVGNRAWQIIAEVNALTNNGANPELACSDLWAGPVSLRLTPSSMALSAGQTAQFTVTAMQGNQPISNLTVELSSSFGLLSGNSVQTGRDGSATFTVAAVTAGTTHLTAQAVYKLPTGTVFEGVNPERQKLVLGEAVEGTVFAEASLIWQRAGDVTVHVFHDRNMDGSQAEVDTEQNLAGWTVFLDDPQGRVVGTAQTDAAGNVTFSNLSNGDYTARYELQDNWRGTNGQPQAITVHDDSQQVLFGVIQTPVVIAYKFHDRNNNGQYDDGEPLLAGGKMALYRENGDFVLGANGVTDSNGQAVLTFRRYSEFQPGVYSVAENRAGQDGWIATTPSEQRFNLEAGKVVKLYFGSRRENEPQPGRIVVVKEANQAQTFGFMGDLGQFTLAAGQAQTFTNLMPKNYTISEDPTSFDSDLWALVSFRCVDEATQQAVEVQRRDYRGTVNLAAGQTLTCTFLNERANFDIEPTQTGTDSQVYLPLIQAYRPEAALERELLTLINQTRRENGCQDLTVNSLLVQAAQAHSKDMAVRDYFDHINPDKLSPNDRLKSLGYQASTLAENIAAGRATPTQTLNDWLSSQAGHRENILDCSLTETGIGYYFLENDTGEFTDQHYWTQVFATPQ